MNKLSWIVYLSEVSERLSVLLVLAGIPTLAAFLVYRLFLFIESEGPPPGAPKILCVASIAMASIITGAALPSRQTILLIAASEGAEVIAMSKDGKEIRNDAVLFLRSWLKDQIKNSAAKSGMVLTPGEK